MARARSTAWRMSSRVISRALDAETDAALAIDSADVRPGDAHQRVFDGRAADVFRVLHRFLDGSDGPVQVHDDALAEAAGLDHAVAAITQPGVGDLRHQRDGLGAADVNRGK